MQTITIKSFGPISSIEMEVNKVNILIGEQAVGKSTICKTIYFFRTLMDEVKTYFTERKITISFLLFDIDEAVEDKTLSISDLKDSINKKAVKIFRELFGVKTDLDDKMYLRYTYSSDIWIECRAKKRNSIEIKLSSSLVQEFEKLILVFNSIENNRIEDDEAKLDEDGFKTYIKEKARLQLMLNQRIAKILDDNRTTYYIPAGRSILSVLAKQKIIEI